MFQASLLKPSITITPLEDYTHHCTSEPRAGRSCSKQAQYAFAVVGKRDPATSLASVTEHFACDRHFGSAVQLALFKAKARFDGAGHVAELPEGFGAPSAANGSPAPKDGPKTPFFRRDALGAPVSSDE